MLVGHPAALLSHSGLARHHSLGFRNSDSFRLPAQAESEEVGEAGCQREVRVPLQRLCTPLLLLGNLHDHAEGAHCFHFDLPHILGHNAPVSRSLRRPPCFNHRQPQSEPLHGAQDQPPRDCLPHCSDRHCILRHHLPLCA